MRFSRITVNPDQMGAFQRNMKVAPGTEWERFTGLDLPAQRLSDFVGATALAGAARRSHTALPVPVPASLRVPRGERLSTQAGAWRLRRGRLGCRAATCEKWCARTHYWRT